MKIELLTANREPLTGRALTEGQRMAEIGAGGLPVWGNGSEAGAAAHRENSDLTGGEAREL